MLPADLVLITGVPGAGKSSVARGLAQQLAQSVVISGDDLRDMVVGGFKSPADVWTEDHLMQYELSFKNASHLARNFIEKGFKVILEDVVHNHHDLFARWQENFQGIRYETVVLAPSLESLLMRNHNREKNLPEEIIYSLHPLMGPENYVGWKIFDTTDQTVAQTVEEIRQHLDW